MGDSAGVALDVGDVVRGEGGVDCLVRVGVCSVLDEVDVVQFAEGDDCSARVVLCSVLEEVDVSDDLAVVGDPVDKEVSSGWSSDEVLDDPEDLGVVGDPVDVAKDVDDVVRGEVGSDCLLRGVICSVGVVVCSVLDEVDVVQFADGDAFSARVVICSVLDDVDVPELATFNHCCSFLVFKAWNC